MLTLIQIEFMKLWRLKAVHISFIVMAIISLIWAYAPGVIDKFDFYVISAYQVQGLTLVATMDTNLILPFLIAIVSASLLGTEKHHGTLPTMLLKPITRSQWLCSKLIVGAIFPFILLAFTFIFALIVSFPFGYGSFIGGTGVLGGNIVGQGELSVAAALFEVFRAYFLAAVSLIPISCMALLFTVLLGTGVSGALASVAALIVMYSLDVFPWLERFLLTSHLDIFAQPYFGRLGLSLSSILLSAAIFAVIALLRFEKTDI